MVFPNEPEYRLKLLDPSHPIWHAEEKVAAEQLRPLLGIEFGCRTSVVYAPPDPPRRPAALALLPLGACPQRAGADVTPAVQAQIDAAPGNRHQHPRLRHESGSEDEGGDSRHRERAAQRDAVERGKMSVAKLRHPGGCDVAPRALVNLMEAAAGQLKLRVDLHPATDRA